MNLFQQGYLIPHCLDLPSARSNHRQHSIDKQARQWFVCMQSDSISSLDLAKFKTWINKDKDHRQAYGHYEKLWKLLGSFSEKAEIRAARARVKVVAHLYDIR